MLPAWNLSLEREGCHLVGFSSNTANSCERRPPRLWSTKLIRFPNRLWQQCDTSMSLTHNTHELLHELLHLLVEECDSVVLQLRAVSVKIITFFAFRNKRLFIYLFIYLQISTTVVVNSATMASVRVVIRLRNGRSCGSNSGGGKGWFCSQKHADRFWGPPRFYCGGGGGLLFCWKWSGWDVKLTTIPSDAEAENEWRRASAPPILLCAQTLYCKVEFKLSFYSEFWCRDKDPGSNTSRSDGYSDRESRFMVFLSPLRQVTVQF